MEEERMNEIYEMNIYQRMAGVTAKLATVAKNLTVSTGKNGSYKAVSERDIIDAVKPLETEYRIYSYPCSREVIETQLLETESNYNGTITKRTTFYERIKTVYRFVNVDNPDEYVETVTFAEGLDSGDKASGKAMTYGDKYALMKAYKISTGDDPDENASRETHYSKVASEADKTAFRKMCAPLGLKPSSVLEEAGWVKGSEVTNDLLAQAIKLITEKGNENHG